MNYRLVFSAFILSAIGALLPTNCEAQRRCNNFRDPDLNAPLYRNLGHRWGSGYHVCNPGHDTTYYSPWSAHNTPSNYFNPGQEWSQPPSSHPSDAPGPIRQVPHGFGYQVPSYRQPTGRPTHSTYQLPPQNLQRRQAPVYQQQPTPAILPPQDMLPLENRRNRPQKYDRQFFSQPSGTVAEPLQGDSVFEPLDDNRR